MKTTTPSAVAVASLAIWLAQACATSDEVPTTTTHADASGAVDTGSGLDETGEETALDSSGGSSSGGSSSGGSSSGGSSSGSSSSGGSSSGSSSGGSPDTGVAPTDTGVTPTDSGGASACMSVSCTQDSDCEAVSACYSGVPFTCCNTGTSLCYQSTSACPDSAASDSGTGGS